MLSLLAVMAERNASVRMAIGFMTNSSVEVPSSHERVADLAGGKESPGPRRRSARMNGVSSSSTGHRSAAVPMASAAGARRTQQLNEAAALRRNPRSSADTRSAGSRSSVWQAAQGVHVPQGEPTTRHDESLVGGDGRTPATNRWVRFAWEPLAVEGGGEHHRGRSSSASAAGSFGGVDGGGIGDGRVPVTRASTLPQEITEGPARQGHEKLGVKRYRASTGGGVSGEEMEETGSSFGGLVGAAPPDRTVWGLQPQNEGWPRRRRCSPRRDGFEASGAAAGQADRGATAPLDSAGSFSLAPRELAGASEVVPQTLAGGLNLSPLLAAERRDERKRITTRGINTRSSGAWGRGRDVCAMTDEEAGAQGNSAATAAAATAYQAGTTYQQQQQQQQQQAESYARGSSAKKPRYHRLHRPPSVGQMDTLTDGVGSLGVASPRATDDGDKRESADASRRRGYVSRRATLIGSNSDAFPPEPAAGCPTALPVGGAGRTDPRAAARGGAGAQGCATTRRQKTQSGATVVGGPGQPQSKRRRNGSLAMGASSFR